MDGGMDGKHCVLSPISCERSGTSRRHGDTGAFDKLGE